jgi:hypothetical protein
MMALTLQVSTNSPLFHTSDKQFKSPNMVQFQFWPEHASDAHNIIAGLIPFLCNQGHTYVLKIFSAEALQQHASSKWDPINMEVGMAEEAEEANS